MLFADVALPTFDLGNVLTGGGFGALVWWLVAKQIPKMQAEFTAALALERQSRSAEMEAERAYRAKITNLVLKMLGAAMTSPAIRDNPELQKALEDFSTDTLSARKGP